MNAPRRPARAEVVGSLLRPQRLLEAQAAGGAVAQAIVEEEVRAAVTRQVELGLDVVTDGEFGRAAFTHSFYDAIEGIEPSPVPVRFRNAAGAKVLYSGVPRICGRLRKVASPLAREADRLRSITDRPFKVTLPAASWFLPAAFFEPGGFYASHDDLLEDTLAIQRALIAEAIFNELPYDVFLIEWDDPDRSGDYGALRHLPHGGPVAVLGLVSSKHAPVETREALLREIERAARHVDVGQLAISPQCGFASVAEGNELSPEAQWAKLEVIARTADEVWGATGS